MFDEFSDNIEIFLQRFPALSSFKNSSSFTINLLLQVIFCRRMLPGYKTENNNSPQKSKLKNTKYSEESSHLAFWVYCYNPQCCTLVLMMVPLKLEQNDFALCIHEWNLDWSWVAKIRQGVILYIPINKAIWVALTFYHWNEIFSKEKSKKVTHSGGNFDKVT